MSSRLRGQYVQNSTVMQENNQVGEWQGGHRHGKTLKNQYRLLGDGRAEVQTSRGLTFFVDETSLPDIEGLTWTVKESTTIGKWYILTHKPRHPTPRLAKFGEPIYLARYLLDYIGPLEVDHRDRDPQNNVMANLRIATRAEQSNNMSLRRDNTSGFNGFFFVKEYPIWRLTWSEQRRQKATKWKRNPEDHQLPAKIQQFIDQLRLNGVNSKLVPQPYVEPSYYSICWYVEGKPKYKRFPNTEEGLRAAHAFRDEKHAEIGNFNGRQ